MPSIPIPQYQRQIAPQGSANPGNLDAGGVDIAKGLSGAGQELGYLGKAVAYKQSADASAWAGAELAKQQAFWTQNLIERQQNVKPGANGFTQSVAEDFKKSREDALKGAPTQQAREYLGARLDALEQDVSIAAVKFEAAEGIANRVRLNEAGNDSARLRVRTHPAEFQSIAAERIAAINESGLPPKEAELLRKAAKEDLATEAVIGLIRKDPEGMMARLYSEQGTSGLVSVESLSADGRQNMVRFAESEFSRLVSARAAQDAAEERAQRDRHEAGDRDATVKALRGELGLGDLQRMIASDNLSPETGRTLANMMKAGSAVNDPQTEFNYRTNLASFTEEEITGAPGLSWDKKADLIEKRRQMNGTWQDSNEYQEAARRIDRALRIPPGTVIQTLDQDTLRRRGEALASLYDKVNEFPLGERRDRAISTANLVIEEVVTTENQRTAERLRARRAAYLKEFPDPSKLTKRGLDDYNQTIARFDSRLAELEK